MEREKGDLLSKEVGERGWNSLWQGPGGKGAGEEQTQVRADVSRSKHSLKKAERINF